MKGIFMDGMNGKIKQWKCGKGHVLGVVVREKVKTEIEGVTVKYHTTKLVIYRLAIDLEAESAAQVDAAGTLYGRMLLGFSWKCSVPGCGCVRDWNPDDEALGWLKGRFGKEGA